MELVNVKMSVVMFNFFGTLFYLEIRVTLALSYSLVVAPKISTSVYFVIFLKLACSCKYLLDSDQFQLSQFKQSSTSNPELNRVITKK